MRAHLRVEGQDVRFAMIAVPDAGLVGHNEREPAGLVHRTDRSGSSIDPAQMLRTVHEPVIDI